MLFAVDSREMCVSGRELASRNGRIAALAGGAAGGDDGEMLFDGFFFLVL